MKRIKRNLKNNTLKIGLLIVLLILFMPVILAEDLMYLEDNIAVYMSEKPHYLICLWQQTGPHFANLTLIGTSKTDSQFNITAKAFYNYSLHYEPGVVYPPTKEGEWQTYDIQNSVIPGEHSVPIISTEQGNGGWRTWECITVKSGNFQEYEMEWQISGDLTKGVRPNHIMYIRSFPWVGNKKVLVLKTRHTPEIPEDGRLAIDNSEEDLINLLNLFSTAFARQSNNLVNISYDIKEAYYYPPYNISEIESCSQTTLCGEELIKGALESVGVNETNFQTDKYTNNLVTFYKSMYDDYTYPVLGPFSGQKRIFTNCSQCEWTSYMTRMETSIRRFLHEFVHGFDYSHDSTRYNITDGNPLEVKEEHLWFHPSYVDDFESIGLMGAASMRIDPIKRGLFGWIKNENIKLITESGEYEVYSDYNNMTFADNQIILQILVKRSSGDPDFVYITVPNINHTSPFEELSSYSKYQMNLRELGFGEYVDRGVLLWVVKDYSDTGTLNSYSYQSNATSPAYLASFGGALLPNQEFCLKWNNTEVILGNLERVGERAVINVTYIKRSPSIITNNEDFDITGNLKLSLQKNITGTWEDQQVVFNNQITLPANNIYDFSQNWNQQNVSATTSGQYRINVLFQTLTQTLEENYIIYIN